MRRVWLTWMLTGVNLGMVATMLSLATRINHTRTDIDRGLTLLDRKVAEIKATEKAAEDALREAVNVHDDMLRNNPCLSKGKL